MTLTRLFFAVAQKMMLELIKKLREETGAGVMDAKQTLEKHAGDYEKAKAELFEKGLAKADTKSDRVTKDGLVYSYVHGTGKVGSLVSVACETDFVARTDEFKKLCHEIALQACSDNYESVDALLTADYIKDESKKIADLIKETVAKVGEKIEIKAFSRFDVRI